jgi:hypothetical protein
MKTIFLFVAMITTSLTIQAQGNLQFNRSMTNGGSIVSPAMGGCGYSPNFTVPEGKVWKIEKYSTTEDMRINGIVVPGGSSMSPIWLNAGDIISFENCSIYSHYYFFNGIEFNLQP